MSRFGFSPLFARIAREAGFSVAKSHNYYVSQFCDCIFDLLKNSGVRNEYVYKSAITHRVLLGTHSLKTASMITEFRVGKCKADVAILNGTATAYEIKSERDSLSRLEQQLCAYRRVFPKVYVISGENHLDDVLSSVPPNVGVMKLSSRYQISTVREAKNDPERISSEDIFSSLRTSEAKQLLRWAKVPVPDVPNTKMHEALRKQIQALAPMDVHRGMVAVLKRSRSLLPLADLIADLPPSLQSAALTSPLRKADHQRLVKAVNTPLDEAFGWG